MIGRGSILIAAVSLWVLAANDAAVAQVRDATYRGTLVCSSLPFMKGSLRTSLNVVIAGGNVRYTQPVLAANAIKLGEETGSGTLEGDQLKLTGGWRGAADSYEASYSGPLKRRSFMLKGTQTWTHDGKTYTRTCSGVIARPLAAFLPKGK